MSVYENEDLRSFMFHCAQLNSAVCLLQSISSEFEGGLRDLTKFQDNPETGIARLRRANINLKRWTEQARLSSIKLGQYVSKYEKIPVLPSDPQSEEPAFPAEDDSDPPNTEPDGPPV